MAAFKTKPNTGQSGWDKVDWVAEQSVHGGIKARSNDNMGG